MLVTDFYEEFIKGVEKSDIVYSNNALMCELGNIMATNREDFIHLLNESGIEANDKMSDAVLTDLFVTNVGKNKKLTLGASVLVNTYNAPLNADGENELSDAGVKAGYEVMCSYFGGNKAIVGNKIVCGNCNHSWAINTGGKQPYFCHLCGYNNTDQYSNVSADPVSAVAEAVGQLAKFGTKASEGIQKGKYGIQDALAKQGEAKNAIAQQLMAQKQAQYDAMSKAQASKDKTKKIVMIIVGSLLGLTVIGGIIFYIKKR